MSEVDYDALRIRLSEAISEVLEEYEEAGVLSSYMLLYEMVHEGSKRSFNMMTANATGEEALMPWVGEGLLHYATKYYDDLEYLYDISPDDEDHSM